MPAGRPMKWATVDEILDNVEDWYIEFDYRNLYNNSFNKEKDLEMFIVNNIESFVSDFLNDTLISFEIDAPIDRKKFWPRWRRIDLLIKWKKSIYIIELKNPSSWTENRAAIWQILDYWREYLDPKKELIILTTKFDINTHETIKYYNLPIRYIYIDKKRILEKYD